MQIAPANTDVLRRGWTDALNTLAPGEAKLSSFLATRLDEAVQRDALDEASLLDIAKEAGNAARKILPPDAATALGKRLQRCVYEYLLSLDAISPEEMTADAAVPTSGVIADRRTAVIGVDEVAEIAEPDPVAETALEPEAEPEPEQELEPEPEPEPMAQSKPELDPQPEPEPEPEAALPVEPPAAVAPALEPEPATVAEPAATDESTPPPSSERQRGRRGPFVVFRRGADAPTESDGEADPAPAEDTPANPASPAALPSSGPARPAPTPVPLNTFVAPRDGFHLTDYSDFADVMDALERLEGEDTAAPPAGAAEVAAPEAEDSPLREAAPRAEASETADGPDTEEPEPTRPWKVRTFRPGRRRSIAIAGQDTDHPVADADAAAAETEDVESPAEQAFNNDPAAINIRRQVDERLRKRKCDEAAALVQRLAADFGGRPVADLALDAGDRCRSLGKSNAALSCYLAASRADPVYDEPLLRLADICIDDRDIDLAVSYLERVARLHRLRGDLKGALRVYRKIATVAPAREDILSVLMRAQATGRFED